MSLIGIHEEPDQDYWDLEKMKKLVTIYEKIIHGDGAMSGLLDHCDSYYKGCWDVDLMEIESLKKQL